MRAACGALTPVYHGCPPAPSGTAALGGASRTSDAFPFSVHFLGRMRSDLENEDALASDCEVHACSTLHSMLHPLWSVIFNSLQLISVPMLFPSGGQFVGEIAIHLCGLPILSSV